MLLSLFKPCIAIIKEIPSKNKAPRKCSRNNFHDGYGKIGDQRAVDSDVFMCHRHKGNSLRL